MASRRRLDAELVRRKLATSRAHAQRLIAEGLVSVAGTTAAKPATMVDPSQAIETAQPAQTRYASRAGVKLAGALDRLGVSTKGRHVLDAGAAHGGFTDVAVRRGAARVVAVDVAYGQLDWRLRNDPRVVVLERTNVRHLSPGDIPDPPPDVVVADLSFISLTLVIPALRGVAAADADFVLLVKPQFEAGRDAVGRGGVVRDPAAWHAAIDSVVAAGDAVGLAMAGACASELPGPAGNIEFFVHLRAGARPADVGVVAEAIDHGLQLRAGAAGYGGDA